MVAPTAKDKSISGLKGDVKLGNTIPLLCAAQGFPAPIYRYFIPSFILWFVKPEPQTSVAPIAKDKSSLGQKNEIAMGGTVPLLCAAQGFPAPIYRYPT